MDDTHPDGPKLGENMDLLFRKHHGSPVITETETLALTLTHTLTLTLS